MIIQAFTWGFVGYQLSCVNTLCSVDALNGKRLDLRRPCLQRMFYNKDHGIEWAPPFEDSHVNLA